MSEAKDTLLSDEQIRNIDITKFYCEKSRTLEFVKYGKAIAQAQAQVSLKEVAAWLEKVSREAGDLREFERQVTEGITALKNGELPE